MTAPLISILIPFKNSEDTLERAIASCQSQSYENLELLLCDGGSTDGSTALINRLQQKDKRLRLIKNEGDGVAAGRMTLLAEARGEYVTFLDSDDALTEDAIDKLWSAAHSTGAALVSAGYYLCTNGEISEEKPLLTPAFISQEQAAIHAYQLHEAKNRSFLWARLYRRDIFEGVVFPHGCYEDIYVTPQLLERADTFVSIEEPLYYYILRDASITFSMKLENHMDGIRARDYCDSFYEKHYPALAPASADLSLEFGFYLLGKITHVGKRQHTDEWNEAVRFIRSKRTRAEKKGLLLQVALLLFTISPSLAGILFDTYSRLKNRV